MLCDGDELRLHLVDRRLVVGERLGAVPADTPSVPLAADVAATQRRLRLTVSRARRRAAARPAAADRAGPQPAAAPAAAARRRLGHAGRRGRGGQGTFWEDWRLAWQPEFAVDLIEASGYGTTVAQAAAAKVGRAVAAAEGNRWPT